MIGWKILKQGEYKLNLPILSAEEEGVVSYLEERFKEETAKESIENIEESYDLLKAIIYRYMDEEGILLDTEQTNYLTEIAHLHIYEFGFISMLLKDENVEEISIVGAGKPAYVFLRNEGWKRVNAMFTTEEEIMNVVNKMARNLGRRITFQNPRLNTILPDGSRLHASLGPISEGEITIRRFRENPFSPPELAETRTVSERALAYLSLLMQSDSSVIVAGNTASGKTTTLNALFSFIPENERIVITEESPEINVPHQQQIRMIANEDMGVSLKDLVYDSLRMRPDRLIIGEVRNKDEVEALFDALLGGQARGCYATFHAQSAKETFRRLNFFGINEIDFKSIDAVVVQRRMLRYEKGRNKEIRKITEIVFDVDKKFLGYDLEKDKWKGKNEEILREKIGMKLGLSEKEIKKEIEKREGILKKRLGFWEFFKEFQNKVYGIKVET
ncbi:type II/IV secretion system ATPase subunit [Candidatus Micrarchaeota archaeon]|nr:type II/IV secretion system ATPase subunit [Candidatus Micrarchaeota archaeon]